MPKLAEATLESFLAAADIEFEDAARRQAVLERQLRFGDWRVRLRFAGHELAEVLLPALSDQRVDGEGERLATISVWEERACVGGSAPFPWGAADIGPGGLVRGSEDDRVVAVHDTYWGAVTLADRASRSLLHRVPAVDRVPWWEHATPLRLALFWAVGGRDRHLVHAGAVGDDRGCVLLVGVSGSGKTTVALAALERGLALVADDYVLLDARGRPTAYSIYNRVSVRGSGLGERKAVSSVPPGSLRDSLPVRAVVAPRISGGHARLRSITGGEALRIWAPATALQMPLDGGAVVASLARVVREVPCFALDVGDEPAELAGAVSQVLESAVQ